MVVPDEERSEPGENCTQMMVRDGLRADFVVCGEPTDMLVGIQAKGVLMMRVDVPGTAAHGATPWLGDSAILRAVDMFRRIEGLPFAAESAPLFERPSINLGRIAGGDAVNKVPDHCRMDVDVRYLPGQHPEEVLAPGPGARPGRTGRGAAGAPARGRAARPPGGAGAARRGRPLRALHHLRRPRRRLRRGGVPGGRGAGGGVRPPRRGPPRPGGVRGDRQPAPLPPGPGRLRPHRRRAPRPAARRPARRDDGPTPPAGGAARGAAAPARALLPDAAPAQAVAGARGVEPLHHPRAGRRDQHRGLHLPGRHPRAGRAEHRGGEGGPRRHPAGAPRRAHQHPAHRVRHAAEGGRPGAQRLADLRADGSAPGLHLDAVLPARLLRADPRRRDGQDQRGVLVRAAPRRSRPSRRSPGSPSTTT